MPDTPPIPDSSKPIALGSLNPADPKMGERIGYNKAILDKLTAATNSYNTIKINGLKNELKIYKDLEKETMSMFKSGSIGAQQFEEHLIDIKEKIENIKKIEDISKGFFRKGFENAGKEGLGILSSMSQKLGIDVERAGVVGWSIWIAGVLDAQRVMAGFAKQSFKLFGDAGGKSGETFKAGFETQASKMNASSLLYVTDAMRQQFTSTLFRSGFQLRGIGGDTYEAGKSFSFATERLLKLGSAFGMTAGEMGEHLSAIQDVFRNTTKQSTDSLEQLIDTSLKLKAAPSAVIGLVQQLTSAFKAQRIEIKDIIDVYNRFWKGGDIAKGSLGIGLSRELTGTVVTSLANLDQGRIAAMLSKVGNNGQPLGGKDLTDALEAFYSTKPGTKEQDLSQSRLQLFLNFMKSFPEELRKDYVSGTALIKYSLGVQDDTVVNKLWESFKTLTGESITGEGSLEAQRNAVDILLDTENASDQFANVIINGLNLAVRYLAIIAKAGGSSDTEYTKFIAQNKKISDKQELKEKERETLVNNLLGERIKNSVKKSSITLNPRELMYMVFSKTLGKSENADDEDLTDLLREKVKEGLTPGAETYFSQGLTPQNNTSNSLGSLQDAINSANKNLRIPSARSISTLSDLVKSQNGSNYVEVHITKDSGLDGIVDISKSFTMMQLIDNKNINVVS